MRRVTAGAVSTAYAGDFARLWRIAADRMPLGGHVKERRPPSGMGYLLVASV